MYGTLLMDLRASEAVVRKLPPEVWMFFRMGNEGGKSKK
jgi:hypothetical protein